MKPSRRELMSNVAPCNISVNRARYHNLGYDMSVRLTIIKQMQRVAREHGKALAPLRDDLELIETGLDSLSLAVLVARLDDELGFDPFSSAQETFLPVTFGDFVKIYENGVR